LWNSHAPPAQYVSEVDSERDAALVDAMRRGDERAFDRVFAAHQQPVFRYASRMCGAAAADDVVQETFMALLRGERFDPARGTLRTYLFGIARHHIARRLNASSLEEPLDGAESGHRPLWSESGASPGSAAETSPFDALSRSEAIDAVRAAIETLPPVYREIVSLCELEELDYADAARVIGRPVGTVRSRLHRAKEMLGAKLERATSGTTARAGGRRS